MTMTATTELARFQAFLDKSLNMQAYWIDKVTLDNGSVIVGNQLKELVNRSYPSVAAADAAALTFPGFAELAAQFAEAPFTAFCALLEALRVVQEAERLAQAEQEPAPEEEPEPAPEPEEEPS